MFKTIQELVAYLLSNTCHIKGHLERFEAVDVYPTCITFQMDVLYLVESKSFIPYAIKENSKY